MHNNTAGTSTDTKDYCSDTCTYYGSYRCDHTPLTDPALTGSWTLKGIMVGAGTSSTIPSTQITLTFKNDGTLNGFGGCNNYNANYVLTGRTTSLWKDYFHRADYIYTKVLRRHK